MVGTIETLDAGRASAALSKTSRRTPICIVRFDDGSRDVSFLGLKVSDATHHVVVRREKKSLLLFFTVGIPTFYGRDPYGGRHAFLTPFGLYQREQVESRA